MTESEQEELQTAKCKLAMSNNNNDTAAYHPPTQAPAPVHQELQYVSKKTSPTFLALTRESIVGFS